MKIPNKQGHQQTAFNRSPDADFKELINLYKKCTSKPCFFFVIDTTLASDNPLRFIKNLIEKIEKIIMVIDGKIRETGIDIKRKAAHLSALSSGKLIIWICYRRGNITLWSKKSDRTS